ncbi:sensory rhodopsin transducer [Flavisolibacter ginsenosidimutans]|uniref:Sensory rhodopsin transducer n=2 Tax=Flavisolibacter ginsenosidimutans TaxID=661481 RepID=A0A5B8UD99_9BACT|nr:sensory rhodopsin transducer [Flavisolibacter ginsenosidimutans]
MNMEIGKKIWAIAEGYIPAWSNGPGREFVSHEAACILNANDTEAHLQLTIYFSDKEPVGPYKITVPAKRTLHLRFNDLKEPQPIPLGTDYSSVFVSDVPVVIQHTRLDSRQDANALLSTIAFAQ